jgi:large subunit ribosomal protein L25
MKELKLKAKERDGRGKGFAKKLRRGGEIPCIVYGHGEKALSVTVSRKDFEELMKKNPSGVGVVNLEIKGQETMWSMIKALQRDPLTDEVLHVDFHHLHKGEKITVDVPVKALGVPVGEKEGGILEQVMHEIRVRVLPSKITSVYEIDVSHLTIGEAIHVKDIDIGEAELEDNPERTVFHIVTPRVVEEPTPLEEELVEVAEGEEEEAEGEAEGEAPEEKGEKAEKEKGEK